MFVHMFIGGAMRSITTLHGIAMQCDTNNKANDPNWSKRSTNEPASHSGRLKNDTNKLQQIQQQMKSIIRYLSLSLSLSRLHTLFRLNVCKWSRSKPLIVCLIRNLSTTQWSAIKWCLHTHTSTYTHVEILV